MKLKILYIIPLLSIVIINGCTDLFTNPGGSSSGKISITVSNPVSNDTIVYKSASITYSIVKNSGIHAVELYVNGTIYSWNGVNSDGTQPSITMSFDSTYIGKRISYCLKYYDDDGTSAYSDTMKNILVVDVSKVPYSPYDFSVTAISSSINNLSWKDSTTSTAPGYEVWRKRGFYGTFGIYVTAYPGIYNVNDNDASDTTVYYYKVRSSNSYGTSDFSPVINTYGDGANRSIAPPTALKAASTATNMVTLTWNDDVGSENYFKIERKYTWGSYSTVGYALKGATQFVDSANGLVTSTSYFYRVKAISGKDSSWSNEVSVTTK